MIDTARKCLEIGDKWHYDDYTCIENKSYLECAKNFIDNFKY